MTVWMVREVAPSRSVFYSISPIGEKLYDLSEDTLEQIRKTFRGKESAIMKMIRSENDSLLIDKSNQKLRNRK